MVLACAQSAEEMERMLRDWITPDARDWDSTSDLPVWQANAMSPAANEEFPFYPEEGVDRARYEAIRCADAPMLCFVQGMESLACLFVENGEITKIGVQSFPG
jgi:hypothetical protein